MDPLPDDFRDRFEQAFTDHAFREKSTISKGEETVGWVRSDNLLETDFSNRDKWLYTHYAMAAMRIDKKVLLHRWFGQRSRSASRSGVRRMVGPRRLRACEPDIRLNIENDMLARTLPTVKVVNRLLEPAQGWVLFENTSDRVNDRFRTLVRNSFGIGLEFFSPLDFLVDSPELVDPLAAAGMTIMRAEVDDDGLASTSLDGILHLALVGL